MRRAGLICDKRRQRTVGFLRLPPAMLSAIRTQDPLCPPIPLASIPSCAPLPKHPTRAQMALLPKMASLVKGYATQAGAAAAAAAGAQMPPSRGGSDNPGRASGGDNHYTGEGTAAAAGTLHPRGMLCCLRVLCAVAGRAPWAAERVASEPGLVEAVREVRAASSRWWCVDERTFVANPCSQVHRLYESESGCPCVFESRLRPLPSCLVVGAATLCPLLKKQRPIPSPYRPAACSVPYLCLSGFRRPRRRSWSLGRTARFFSTSPTRRGKRPPNKARSHYHHHHHHPRHENRPRAPRGQHLSRRRTNSCRCWP